MRNVRSELLFSFKHGFQLIQHLVKRLRKDINLISVFFVSLFLCFSYCIDIVNSSRKIRIHPYLTHSIRNIFHRLKRSFCEAISYERCRCGKQRKKNKRDAKYRLKTLLRFRHRYHSAYIYLLTFSRSEKKIVYIPVFFSCLIFNLSYFSIQKVRLPIESPGNLSI